MIQTKIQKPKIQLFDSTTKERLYLNPEERKRFASVLWDLPNKYERMFCQMLHNTGCRLQEALNLTYGQIDVSERCVIIETLKRRKKGHIRQIPLPDDFIKELDLVYDLKELQSNRKTKKNKEKLQERIWTFSNVTAWRRVKEAMALAEITGKNGSPKGIRHGFAIFAITEKKIPITTVQK